MNGNRSEWVAASIDHKVAIPIWVSILLLAPALIGVGVGAPVVAQPGDSIPTLEERISALEGLRDTFLAVAGTTLAGSVVAFFIGWIRLVKKADQLARMQMDRIVESYPGAVERLVQEHETEARLRREARVALVSDRLDLQALLRTHGFRNLTTVRIADAGSEVLEPCAAVVLDLTGGLQASAAAALVEAHPRDVFLAYSTATSRVDLPAGRATFANSPITLYARLMELLKFHQARQSEV